jgi:hypothetical protein
MGVGESMVLDVQVLRDETIGWITPWSKRRGETPNISAFLQFRFYEQVYNLDPDDKLPSTKENTGYWLWVAEYVGDKLCYHILMTDTHRVIERSVVRSSERSQKNHTLVFPRDNFLSTLPIQTDNNTPVEYIDDEIITGVDYTSDTTPITRNTNKSTNNPDIPKTLKSHTNKPRHAGLLRTRSHSNFRDLSGRNKANRLANLVSYLVPRPNFFGVHEMP